MLSCILAALSAGVYQCLPKVAEGNKQLEPYVLVVGDVQSPTQTFLVTDQRVITEIDTDDVPLTLMAAYFAFTVVSRKRAHGRCTLL